MEQDTANGAITIDACRNGLEAISGRAHGRYIRARRNVRELLRPGDTQIGACLVDPCHGIPEIVIGDECGLDQSLQLRILKDLKPAEVPKGRGIRRCGWLRGAAEDRRGGESRPLVVWTD